MASYSRELKEQIVRKMMPPNPQSGAPVSRETGISAPTLYAWRKQFRSVFAKPSDAPPFFPVDSRVLHVRYMNRKA